MGWSVALCNSNSSAEHPCTVISFLIIPQAKIGKSLASRRVVATSPKEWKYLSVVGWLS